MHLKLWQYVVIAFLAAGFMTGGYFALSHLEGCAATPVASPNNAQGDITGANTTTKDVTTDVGTRANTIDTHVTNIKAKTPTNLAPVFGPFLTGINNETAGLRVDQGKLETVQAQLTQAQIDDGAKDTTIKNQQTTIDKLNNSETKLLHVILAIVIGICVLGLCAGGALVYLQEIKIGIAVLIGSSIGIAAGIMLLQYAIWVAIAGGIIILGCLGYLAYLLIKNKGELFTANTKLAATTATLKKTQDSLSWHKTALASATTALTDHKTALLQVVQSCEATKHAMPIANKQYLFGSGAIPGAVDVYQNPTTQQLVNEARKHIRLAPDTSKLIAPKELTRPIGQPNTMPEPQI